MSDPKISNASAMSGVAQTSKTKATTKTSAGDKPIPMVSGEPKNEPAEKAKNALTAKIKDGQASYNQSNWGGDLMGLIFDKKAGDQVVITDLPEGTTLGDIRKQYNLPPGSLRHLVSSGGGDFDTYKAPTNSNGAYVYIYTDDLAEGVGVSERELKGMFPEKQFSPWYKLGTND